MRGGFILLYFFTAAILVAFKAIKATNETFKNSDMSIHSLPGGDSRDIAFE